MSQNTLLLPAQSPLPSPAHISPTQIVQAQLDAYNRKDLAGWLATYAPDACQYALHGECLARGHAQISQRIEARFQEPDLHATLLQRTVMGPLVVDHERVRRNFPQGPGTVEMICIYEVRQGLIQTATFAVSAPRLHHDECRTPDDQHLKTST